MTFEEKEELKAMMLAALLDYDAFKKAQRLKTVNNLIRGSIAATALTSVGCTSINDKPLVANNNQTAPAKAIAATPKKTTPPVNHAITGQILAKSNQSVEPTTPASITSHKQAYKGVIHFTSGSSTLTTAHRERLDLLIKQLPNNAELIVIGRTDVNGSSAYNSILGKSRARNVANYLSGRGITIKSIASKGEKESAQGWEARRVDVVINHPLLEKVAINLPPSASRFDTNDYQLQNPIESDVLARPVTEAPQVNAEAVALTQNPAKNFQATAVSQSSQLNDADFKNGASTKQDTKYFKTPYQSYKGVVHFTSGSSALAAAHKERLDLLIKQLPSDAELIIIGRTDVHGSVAYNNKLGKNRARNVANYLAERGITIKSIASKSDKGRAKGWEARRVDVAINQPLPEKLAIQLPPLSSRFDNNANDYQLQNPIQSGLQAKPVVQPPQSEEKPFAITQNTAKNITASAAPQPAQLNNTGFKNVALIKQNTTQFKAPHDEETPQTLGATLLKNSEWSGAAGLDLRFFTQSPALPGQNSSFASPSVYAQPEFRYDWDNDSDRFTAVPFVRYDSLDTNRTHWDVREFNWLHKGDGWNLQTGVSKVFWGVTESRHLVDIVNQSDSVENINNEEKLGQPMVNLNIPTRDWGNFNLLYLPYFRERTFPARSGRLRFLLPVDTDHPDLNGRSNWHPDFAVRWSKTLGDWDFGIAHFRGISREPRLVPFFPNGNTNPPREAPTALIPTYDLIDQTSLDVQGALGNWLLKLEAMTRGGPFDRFAAVTAGFEYTHYGVLDSSADLGLLMEYQYDGREKFSLTKATQTLPTPFDNDLFLGSRLSLNDEANTQMLLGVIVDLNTQATLVSLEASRRLGDKWKVELESRLFKNVPSTDILGGSSRDDYVQLRLVRFF